MKKFNAGMIQFDVQKGKIQTNIDCVTDNLDVLSDQGISLAVLPEMFSCSFDNKHLRKHAEKTDDILLQLSAQAARKQIAITGSLPVQEKGQILNTMFFIDTDGRVKGSYKKLHLFKLTHEDEYYTPGSRTAVIDTSFGRVGLMICYDLRFPELARMLTLKGAEMILVSAQWPSPRVSHWQTLLTARAIENQLFVIGTNRTGKEGDLDFPGMSMIVDPLGTVISNAGADHGTGWGEIDLKRVEKTRSIIPCMTDRRADIYG